MIPEAMILSALAKPEVNRFVSQEKRENLKVSVQTEPETIERLRLLAGEIREAEKAFLQSVADRNESLQGFFNDTDITPSPQTNLDLTPYMQQDSLNFTLSCLAPKAGNPQKTDQSLPDLGELALLIHFEELANIATQRYGKPVTFTLLTERGYLADVIGFDAQRARTFDEKVKFLSQEIVGNKKVTLQDWHESVMQLPGYNEEYAKQRAELQNMWNNDPSQIEKEFLQIIPTIYMTIEPQDENIKAIYSLRRSEATRRQIAKATEGTLNLMAFNRAKKICGDRDALFKDAIYASLTPGTGKFALYSIGPWSLRYPTHGVGVFDTETKRVTIYQTANVRESRRSKNLRLSN